jgi:hypothetical protein
VSSTNPVVGISGPRLTIVLTLTATWKGFKPAPAEKGNVKLMAAHNRAGAVALDVGSGLMDEALHGFKEFLRTQHIPLSAIMLMDQLLPCQFPGACIDDGCAR